MSMLMCIQNLVKFCQFRLKILSGNEILTSIKGRNSIKILRKMTGNNPKLDHVNVDVGPNSIKILRKMTGNNPNLDHVNVDVHTKFGQILSIRSQDIERKRNSDVNQGLQLHQNFVKNDGQNPKLDHVNVDVHTKFGQILSIRSQDIERKRNSDVNQGL